ncbi:hypothetical protein GYMLUDRAFT_55491 [Collybiopsis luxurians FD-317 M1]|nr:hypothetical protein GYMLUDRAFT_55491 [Collybiopsis luxurians FD-317 M1]
MWAHRKSKTLIPLYYPGLKNTGGLLFMTECLTNAKYLVSNDQEFIEEGSTSKISYYKEFWKILHLLKNAKGSKYHKVLHLYWNQHVFKGKTSAHSGAGDDDNEASDLDDMTEALQAITISEVSGPTPSAGSANLYPSSA